MITATINDQKITHNIRCSKKGSSEAVIGCFWTNSRERFFEFPNITGSSVENIITSDVMPNIKGCSQLIALSIEECWFCANILVGFDV